MFQFYLEIDFIEPPYVLLSYLFILHSFMIYHLIILLFHLIIIILTIYILISLIHFYYVSIVVWSYDCVFQWIFVLMRKRSENVSISRTML